MIEFAISSDGSYLIDDAVVSGERFFSEWAHLHVEGALHGDHTSARFLEDEIERRGLQRAYIEALIVAVEPDVSITDLLDDLLPMWRLFRATPEQRARAFLEAVKGV